MISPAGIPGGISSVIVFFGSFIFYVRNLAPTVSSRDSGEFIAVAKTLGCAHAPGYPLFSVIGRIFSFIPLANPGYRVNLVSAFFSALSLAVFYAILRNFPLKKGGSGIFPLNKGGFGGVSFPDSGGCNSDIFFSLCITAVLAVSPVLYSESVLSEIFAANLFFSVLIIFLVLKIMKTGTGIYPFRDACWTYLLFFVYGLALSVHQQSVFLLPAVIVVIFSNTAGNWRKLMPVSALLFLAGFSVNIFPLLRAVNNPAIAWIEPKNIYGLFRLLLRLDYGALKIHHASHLQQAGIVRQLGIYFMTLFSQGGYVISLASIAGAVILWKKSPRLFYILAGSLLLIGPFFISIARLPDIASDQRVLERFYLPSVMLLFLFAGALDIKKVYPLIVLLLPAVLFFSEKQLSARNNFIAYDYIANVFRALPEKSLYFARGDTPVFSAWYYQLAEEKRPDVRYLSAMLERWYVKKISEDLGFSGVFASNADFAEKYISGNIAKDKKIFIQSGVEENYPFMKDYSLEYRGLVFRVRDKNNPVAPDLIDFPELIIRKNDPVSAADPFDIELLNFYTVMCIQASLNALNAGERGRAYNDIKNAERINGRHEKIWTHYGYLESLSGRYPEAIESYKKALSYNTHSYDAGIGLAESYYLLSMWKESVSEYERLLRHNREQEMIMTNIGNCYFSMKDYEKAFIWFEGTIKHNPAYYAAYNGAGLSQYLLGNKKSAALYLKKALEINPGYIEARDNLLKIEKGN